MGYDTPYTFSEIRADVLEKARIKAGSYDRYSKTQVDRAINAALLEMVSKIQNLHSFAIIILKNGYPQYAAPSDMIHPQAAFFYQNTKSYYEVPFKTKEWMDKHTPGWRQITGTQPLYMFPGYSDGYKRYLGVTPIPTADGDNYLSTPDTGVVISATGMTTSGNIIGQNNTANATVCTDSASRTLASLGAKIGMVALNNNDGSKGQISVISGATFTAALAGGTNNTWAVGDTFTILAGEYGVVTGITSADEQYVFNQETGELINLSALTNNIYLEYYRRPLLLQYDTQYPEAPYELHEFISDGALYRLKRLSEKGTDDYSTAVASKQIFDAAIRDYTTIDDSMDSSGMDFNW